MKKALVVICLFAFVAPAAASTWSGPKIEGWMATNEDGFCRLVHSIGTGSGKILFMFASLPRDNDPPHQVTFHVTPIQCELAWPVSLVLGSAPNAETFKVEAESATPRYLPMADARQLMQHLNAGGKINVYYALSGGVQRHAVLGQHNFAQSVAMFEACASMLPNYAMQRSARVGTPLAGTGTGAEGLQLASGAPTARRR